MTSQNIRRMCVLAGISILAATAAAIPSDGAQISIDRALNSPTLTIHYTGANTALVELRLNGESLGTRAVNSAKSSGDTNFDINLSDLKDGDNQVEVRLFDRTGKLIGSDKTNISTEQSDRGPVFLSVPKMGETVQGPVEIKMGFGKDLKDVYVSFFVDNNFKKMTNYPPFVFQWDTTTETNGWHEVEAWAIDGASTTYKTRKTRVFINNPGGRTDRTGVNIDLTPRTNPTHPTVSGVQAGLRVAVTGHSKATGTIAGAPAPYISRAVNPSRGHVAPGAMSGAKSAANPTVIATGPKSLTPTGLRQAVHGGPLVAMTSHRAQLPSHSIHISSQVLNSVSSAANLLRIMRGSRIPNVETFAVVMDNSFVNFDVLPRVDNGVPMTPFRYLFEKAGGKVGWQNMTKTVTAHADGRDVVIQIGDKAATVNKVSVEMELTPYIERGRTIVPVSFIHDALNVDIEYDKDTGHVLITSLKK